MKGPKRVAFLEVMPQSKTTGAFLRFIGEKMNEYRTKYIGVAAALLASGKTSFVGMELDPLDGHKWILLSPKDIAEQLENQLTNQTLEINAAKQLFFVNELKKKIFERGQDGTD